MATLILDDDEKARLQDWKKQHYDICKYRPGTMGDLYHFEVLPTGLGTFVTVHCPCGAEADIEDGEVF